MGHPASCNDPTCRLTYREHLLGVGITMDSMPTRNLNEDRQTGVRERRWERDHAAYERMAAQGIELPHLDGARAREKYAERTGDAAGALDGHVRVDWKDPTD